MERQILDQSITSSDATPLGIGSRLPDPLWHDKISQGLVMLACIPLVLVLGALECVVSWTSPQPSLGYIFPDVDSPFALILTLLAFLSALAITVATQQKEEGRVAALANFSYWTCVFSSAFVFMLCGSLCDELGIVKGIATTAASYVTIYFLGRFSNNVNEEAINRLKINLYDEYSIYYTEKINSLTQLDADGMKKEGRWPWSSIVMGLGALLLIGFYGFFVSLTAFLPDDKWVTPLCAGVLSLCVYLFALWECVFSYRRYGKTEFASPWRSFLLAILFLAVIVFLMDFVMFYLIGPYLFNYLWIPIISGVVCLFFCLCLLIVSWAAWRVHRDVRGIATSDDSAKADDAADLQSGEGIDGGKRNRPLPAMVASMVDDMIWVDERLRAFYEKHRPDPVGKEDPKS